MTEKHPFGSFVPKNTKYLILGSFTGRPEGGYDWFYCTKRNQFWPILERLYKVNLSAKKDKQKLFCRLKIAEADIILECERKKGNNSDTNLKIIKFNKKEIARIFMTNNIEMIYFSSRFVEKLFKREFKDFIPKYSKVKLITLPSPSPRYAKLTLSQKADIYKKLMPSV